MSQAEVSKLLGIDRSTYTYYETGKIRVPLAVLDKLAEIYLLPRGFYLQTDDTDPVLLFRQSRPEAAEASGVVQIGVEDVKQDEQLLLARLRILKKAGLLDLVVDYMDELLSENGERPGGKD